MNNQKLENLSYITEVKGKNTDIKNIEYTPKKSPDKKKVNMNSQTIQYSEPRRTKNIISIVFPVIKPQPRSRIMDLFSYSQKYLNSKEEANKNEQTYNKIKNISVSIPKLNKQLVNFNSAKNNRIIDSSDNDSKNNSINNSHSNSKVSNYYTTTNNKKDLTSINHVECNLNLSNLKNKSNNNRFNNSTKIQILKQKIFNQEQGAFSFAEFLKKELKMEEKIKLYPSFLQRYSPRLLRRKNNKILNYRNNNTIINTDDYKIRTSNFKNQTIPYLDKIDVRKISSILPPIVLGSKYNLPEKTEEDIKKENFYKEIARIERERKKGKTEDKKISKKDMLKILQKRKLINCKEHIYRTRKNKHDTKIKIDIFYNKLKKSLNQFDDWNDPENVDNLYDV